MEINNLTPLPVPLNPVPANLAPVDTNSINNQVVILAALNAAMKDTLNQMVEQDKAAYDEKLANDPLQPLNQEQETEEDWIQETQVIQDQQLQYLAHLANNSHQ